MPEEDYLRLREEQEEPTEFAEGWGVKALLAGLFVAFVVMPGSMFMWLMLGQQLGTPAVWVTLIIFLEIAKRCRTTLTRQEMFVIFSVTWGVLTTAIPVWWMDTFVGMTYFVRSDAAVQFEIANQIPFWKAPPPGSEAYIQRSLLHRDWWPQLALMALFIVWGRLSFFSLGYIMFRVTSDVERLPFPLAPIAAKGVTALAESDEETWRWRCFSVGSSVGIVFGLIYVAVPTLSGVFLRKPLYLLPVPFYDFTTKLQDVGWFRAVPLAIGTDLGLIFWGFVLPFWMVMGQFTAAVLGRLVLNPILYRVGVLKLWSPGMDYIQTGLANQFDFWLSFAVGTAVAIALLGFYTSFRQAMKAQRERTKTTVSTLAPPKGRGDVPITVALLFYVAGTFWVIMLCHWLVPKFPIWILLAFGFGYTPVMSYVSARLHGLTGHAVGIPYALEAAFVLSGYKGVDIWYAPVPMYDAGCRHGPHRRGGGAAVLVVPLQDQRHPRGLPLRDAVLAARRPDAGLLDDGHHDGQRLLPEGHQLALHLGRHDLRRVGLHDPAAAGRTHPVPLRDHHRPGGRSGRRDAHVRRRPAGALLHAEGLRRGAMGQLHPRAGRRLRGRHRLGRHGGRGHHADPQGHYHGAILTY